MKFMARRMRIFHTGRVLALWTVLFSIHTVIAQNPQIQIFPPALSTSQPTVLSLLTGTLVNTTGSPQSIYLYADVSKNGIHAGSATSARFTLQPGPLIINAINGEALLNPIDGRYENLDPAYILRTGTIPPGDYSICIYAIGNDTVGKNCYDLIVMDLNPPILVMPMNGDAVDVPFPTFIWTPPTPLQEPPTYRLRLVQLLSNQSPVAALGNNTAFHDVDGLFTNLYQYPIAARQLEDGRRYAWQIGVYVGGALMTQSEIFTFDYHNPHAVAPTTPLLDKVIMIVGMESGVDTIIERSVQGLRFDKSNGELTFSEQGYFNRPTLVHKLMDKDQKLLMDKIVFVPVRNGLGYEMQFFAPANQSGQRIEYLNYVSPGGEVFSYRFRE